MIPFSAEKKQCCLRQLDSATDLLTPDPLTKHRILPFTVSETQPHFSGSYTRHRCYQPFSLPPPWTPCPHCLYVMFHSSSNNLFILLSAMSWFPFKLCPLPSHNISPYLTLMPWQEVSAHTWCLYFPKEVSCTEITQTGYVNKITIRKNDVAEGLEHDSNLRKKHRFGWGSWGVTIKQNNRVLGQHRKRAPEVSPRHHPFTHLYLNSI